MLCLPAFIGDQDRLRIDRQSNHHLIRAMDDAQVTALLGRLDRLAVGLPSPPDTPGRDLEQYMAARPTTGSSSIASTSSRPPNAAASSTAASASTSTSVSHHTRKKDPNDIPVVIPRPEKRPIHTFALANTPARRTRPTGMDDEVDNHPRNDPKREWRINAPVETWKLARSSPPTRNGYNKGLGSSQSMPSLPTTKDGAATAASRSGMNRQGSAASSSGVSIAGHPRKPHRGISKKKLAATPFTHADIPIIPPLYTPSPSSSDTDEHDHTVPPIDDINATEAFREKLRLRAARQRHRHERPAMFKPKGSAREGHGRNREGYAHGDVNGTSWKRLREPGVLTYSHDQKWDGIDIEEETDSEEEAERRRAKERAEAGVVTSKRLHQEMDKRLSEVEEVTKQKYRKFAAELQQRGMLGPEANAMRAEMMMVTDLARRTRMKVIRGAHLYPAHHIIPSNHHPTIETD
jgi:hypothetical protein